MFVLHFGKGFIQGRGGFLNRRRRISVTTNNGKRNAATQDLTNQDLAPRRTVSQNLGESERLPGQNQNPSVSCSHRDRYRHTLPPLPVTSIAEGRNAVITQPTFLDADQLRGLLISNPENLIQVLNGIDIISEDSDALRPRVGGLSDPFTSVTSAGGSASVGLFGQSSGGLLATATPQQLTLLEGCRPT